MLPFDASLTALGFTPGLSGSFAAFLDGYGYHFCTDKAFRRAAAVIAKSGRPPNERDGPAQAAPVRLKGARRIKAVAKTLQAIPRRTLQEHLSALRKPRQAGESAALQGVAELEPRLQPDGKLKFGDYSIQPMKSLIETNGRVFSMLINLGAKTISEFLTFCTSNHLHHEPELSGYWQRPGRACSSIAMARMYLRSVPITC